MNALGNVVKRCLLSSADLLNILSKSRLLVFVTRALRPFRGMHSTSEAGRAIPLTRCQSATSHPISRHCRRSSDGGADSIVGFVRYPGLRSESPPAYILSFQVLSC